MQRLKSEWAAERTHRRQAEAAHSTATQELEAEPASSTTVEAAAVPSAVVLNAPVRTDPEAEGPVTGNPDEAPVSSDMDATHQGGCQISVASLFASPKLFPGYVARCSDSRAGKIGECAKKASDTADSPLGTLQGLQH